MLDDSAAVISLVSTDWPETFCYDSLGFAHAVSEWDEFQYRMYTSLSDVFVPLFDAN